MGNPRWMFMYLILRGIAAEAVVPITYGQLAAVMRVAQGRGCHRRYMGGMLRKVYQKCMENGEPDLTAHVVGVNGKPGTGWDGWAKGALPESVRADAHEHFRKEMWGK